jgi:hypothetical protein
MFRPLLAIFKRNIQLLLEAIAPTMDLLFVVARDGTSNNFDRLSFSVKVLNKNFDDFSMKQTLSYTPQGAFLKT